MVENTQKNGGEECYAATKLEKTVSRAHTALGAMQQLLANTNFTTRRPPPVPRPFAFSDPAAAYASNTGWLELHETALPVSSATLNPRQAQPPVRGADELSRNVERPVSRICQTCWTRPGTLLCEDCSAFTCGPCVTRTHTVGLASQHRVIAAPVVRGGANENVPPNAGLLGEKNGKLLHEWRRRNSVQSMDELRETPDTLLQYQALPDPDPAFALPPPSRLTFQAAGLIVDEEELVCQQHVGERYTHVCRDCGFLLLCGQCRYTEEHRGHTAVSLEQGGRELRAILLAERARLAATREKLLVTERLLEAARRQFSPLRQSLQTTVRGAYKSLFRSIKEKYQDMLSRYTAVNRYIAREAYEYAIDLTIFRDYLVGQKQPQIQALYRIGNRHASAGLNAWTAVKESWTALVSRQQVALADMPQNLRKQPWWTLNPFDGDTFWEHLSVKIRRELDPIDNLLVRIATVSRVLFDRAVEGAAHANEPKRNTEAAATQPVPLSADFFQQPPSLEGLVYRRDPVRDWAVVRLSLYPPFLISFTHQEEHVEQREFSAADRLRTAESAIHLLDPRLVARLDDVSALAQRSLHDGQQRGLLPPQGVSVLELVLLPETTDAQVETYWFFASDTEGALEMWLSAVDQVRSSGGT